MTAFLFYLLKLTLCSGVLFVYYHLALRNKLFHQWNRFYLLMAVLLSLTLPLVKFTVLLNTENQNDALLFLQSLPSANAYLEEFVLVSKAGASPETWFWLAYTFICGLFLFHLLHSLLRMVLLIRKHSFQSYGGIKLADSGVAGTPFSFLQYIFWNKDIPLDTATGQRVFQHEVVHIKEKHTLDKLFLQLVLALFWFNPFFWAIRKELWYIHEFIADKKAVGENDAAAFAAMILQASHPRQFSAFSSSLFQTSIKRRIRMLTKKQSINYVSRVAALPVIALVAFTVTVRSNATDSFLSKTQSQESKSVPGVLTDTIPQRTKEITSVDVNKNAKTITLRYIDGSAETLTEQEARKRGMLKGETTQKKDTISPKPLFIVDGKEFNGDVNSIDANGISSVNVLKGAAAIDKYGDKGKNGVVEITLKKSNESLDPRPDDNIIFQQTETPASIDKEAWRTFLSKNLQSIIVTAAKQGAKSGSYTVNIRFLVKKDGKVSDFTALNDPGYDFAKKILAVMPNSPKWKPAEQNGKRVHSYHTQPVTFVIQDQ
jgi:hypothetical protein